MCSKLLGPLLTPPLPFPTLPHLPGQPLLLSEMASLVGAHAAFLLTATSPPTPKLL